MDDTISRKAAIDAIKKSRFLVDAMEKVIKLPSAQQDLITKIQNGIKATDADDVYSCGMRNGMRWCISLIDDKEPLYENCPSAQPDCSDCIKHGGDWDCDHVHCHKGESTQSERKGKWIRNDNGTYSCSVCQSWIPEEQHFYAQYCLYCGARMEEEHDELLR